MNVPQPRDARGRFCRPLVSSETFARGTVGAYVKEFQANDGILKIRENGGEYTIVRRTHPTVEGVESTKGNRCLVFFKPDQGTRTGNAVLFDGYYASSLYGGQMNFQPYITQNWYSEGRGVQPSAEAFCAMVVVGILNRTMPLTELICGKIIRSDGGSTFF